jgi:hypothetical protein
VSHTRSCTTRHAGLYKLNSFLLVLTVTRSSYGARAHVNHRKLQFLNFCTLYPPSRFACSLLSVFLMLFRFLSLPLASSRSSRFLSLPLALLAFSRFLFPVFSRFLSFDLASYLFSGLLALPLAWSYPLFFRPRCLSSFCKKIVRLLLCMGSIDYRL